MKPAAAHLGLLATFIIAPAEIAAGETSQEVTSRQCRDIATSAANWIRASAIESPDGLRWPADPAKPDAISTDLYSGTPGVILFFLELHRATGDQSCLDDARNGGHALIARLVDYPAAMEEFGGGLYTGLSGAGFALHRVFKATGDAVFLDAANRCVDRIIEAMRSTGEQQPEWMHVNDIISGLAGTGLFLLYASEEMRRPDARDAARACGDILISRAAEKHEGLMWPMSPEVKNTYPNFSHGTAGVSYFLASLYRATKEQKYLDAASGGAHYLLAIADNHEGTCRVPRFDPDEYAEGEPPLYYVSWCHGPAGTGRLFDLLHDITGDDEWRVLRDRMAATLLNPAMLSDESRDDIANGFWHNVGRCCGNAGVGQFMLLMHRRTGQMKYLQFARELTDDLIARGVRDETAQTIHWPHAEHRIQPDNIVAQTGLMQGASGIGLWLLELDAALAGRDFTMRLPDDRD